MDIQLVNNLEKLEQLFSTRMRDYEEKLQKVTTGAGCAQPDITTLSREFHDFKSFVWQTLAAMKSQIELLTLSLDRHETAMRRKVLLLHGVPEISNEKLHEVVHRVLTDRMKLTDVSLDNLHICHRLGSPQAKTRPVLVRFHDVEHRHLVWDSKTALKGTGITVSEFLTKSRHRVFMAARTHFGIRQCWTVEGKISIILPDKSRRKIESLGELQHLISQFPSSKDCLVETQDSSSPKTSSQKTNVSAPRKARRRN